MHVCVYTTHAIPNKSRLGEGLGRSSLEGIATPYPAGPARLCPGRLISHPQLMGGILPDGVPPTQAFYLHQYFKERREFSLINSSPV